MFNGVSSCINGRAETIEYLAVSAGIEGLGCAHTDRGPRFAVCLSWVQVGVLTNNRPEHAVDGKDNLTYRIRVRFNLFF